MYNSTLNHDYIKGSKVQTTREGNKRYFKKRHIEVKSPVEIEKLRVGDQRVYPEEFYGLHMPVKVVPRPYGI